MTNFASKFIRGSILALGLCLPGLASAATVSLVYNGGTSNGKVTITAAPTATASGTLPMNVGAFGFKMTDTTGQMGSFTAFCMDISRWLQGSGQYDTTTTPFTNSYPVSAAAMARIQAVFDANFASVLLTNAVQAAGFQVALWNALYDTDWSAGSGVFAVMDGTSGATAQATAYLVAAQNYAGGQQYNMTFLQSKTYNQNLVTVSPVPLPAAGGMLLAALAGLAMLRRRRQMSV